MARWIILILIWIATHFGYDAAKEFAARLNVPMPPQVTQVPAAPSDYTVPTGGGQVELPPELEDLIRNSVQPDSASGQTPDAQPPAVVVESPQQAQPSGLSPETVYGWCHGEQSRPERFEQLREANGVINPNGVHMITGPPIACTIPDGHTAQIWDCFQLHNWVTGYYPQVCEMTVRKLDY